MTRVHLESYRSYISKYIAIQDTAKPDGIYVVYNGRTSSNLVCHLCCLIVPLGTLCCMQGMSYSPVKFIGTPDAQCLQGMPYFPLKFTAVPDAQCLQGMPYSPVKFTGAPDAQCLQGMSYSPVKITAAPDAKFLQGMLSLTNYSASWYAVYYIRILKSIK